MPVGNAPTPGSTSASALRRVASSRVIVGLGADVLERLLDRATVAHVVVDDRDARRPRGAHVSVPLVLGTPTSVGSTDAAARSARAKALKTASIMWCAFVPASTVTCSVSFAFAATARKELLGQLVVVVADRAGRELSFEHQQPAAGDVDRAGRARLIHRHGRAAVARDPGAIAERAVERLADADADVLDRVMRAGLQIAGGAHLQVEPPVAGEQVEHVVKEADAGLARALPGAVERQRDGDPGLPRPAIDRARAAHVS